ncbi:hypothetical protein P692DRAFT_20828680 [Suillus brevipes Sb2]|nr:hypothetical protein P692DRAFT_20828680 [Suillus brevipes Sb2]
MLLATTSNPDKHKNLQSLEVRLAEVGNELRQERYKCLQAERALNKIEIEKRTLFVVPALFQAFLMVSEMHISHGMLTQPNATYL